MAIRKCYPGRNVCANLAPGGGADTDFVPLRQTPGGVKFAATRPGFFWGYYSKFDPNTACGENVFQLARVMVHEAAHACKMAGGSNANFDSYDILGRCTDPDCCADAVAPVDLSNKKVCGD